MDALSVEQWLGSLCALDLLPGPPFPPGSRELIRPAAALPCLIAAEKEPAKPKLLILEPRLAAGACLLHRSCFGVAQKTSRMGWACLQRSRDVCPCHCHTALLHTWRGDTGISWNAPVMRGISVQAESSWWAGEGFCLRRGRCHACRRVSHVRKKAALGIKKTICPAPSSKHEEEGEDLGLPPPAMPRCSCGRAALLQMILLCQGEAQRGWSHPQAVHCLHKATLEWGLLRTRIWQVFNWCELLFGKQRRSRGCSPVQVVGWLSWGSSSFLGMLQARQPHCCAATALHIPPLQIGHRIMLLSVFYVLGSMTKYSRELKRCSCLEKIAW